MIWSFLALAVLYPVLSPAGPSQGLALVDLFQGSALVIVDRISPCWCGIDFIIPFVKYFAKYMLKGVV